MANTEKLKNNSPYLCYSYLSYLKWLINKFDYVFLMQDPACKYFNPKEDKKKK